MGWVDCLHDALDGGSSKKKRKEKQRKIFKSTSDVLKVDREFVQKLC